MKHQTINAAMAQTKRKESFVRMQTLIAVFTVLAMLFTFGAFSTETAYAQNNDDCRDATGKPIPCDDDDDDSSENPDVDPTAPDGGSNSLDAVRRALAELDDEHFDDFSRALDDNGTLFFQCRLPIQEMFELFDELAAQGSPEPIPAALDAMKEKCLIPVSRAGSEQHKIYDYAGFVDDSTEIHIVEIQTSDRRGVFLINPTLDEESPILVEPHHEDEDTFVLTTNDDGDTANECNEGGVCVEICDGFLNCTWVRINCWLEQGEYAGNDFEGTCTTHE